MKLIYLIRELGRLKYKTVQTNTKLQYKQQMEKELGISFYKVLLKDDTIQYTVNNEKDPVHIPCEMMSAIVLIFNAAWLSLSV